MSDRWVGRESLEEKINRALRAVEADLMSDGGKCEESAFDLRRNAEKAEVEFARGESSVRGAEEKDGKVEAVLRREVVDEVESEEEGEMEGENFERGNFESEEFDGGEQFEQFEVEEEDGRLQYSDLDEEVADEEQYSDANGLSFTSTSEVGSSMRMVSTHSPRYDLRRKENAEIPVQGARYASYLSTAPSRRRESDKRRSGRTPTGFGNGSRPTSPSFITKPGEEHTDRTVATEAAMRKLINEMRELKKQREDTHRVSQEVIHNAVQQARRQMDEDFRLVVKSLLDEKARAIHAVEKRVSLIMQERDLERNRCGMALAELESTWMERKTNIPRYVKFTNTAKPAVCEIQYITPDNTVRFEPNDNYEFADEEEEGDGQGISNLLLDETSSSKVHTNLVVKGQSKLSLSVPAAETVPVKFDSLSPDAPSSSTKQTRSLPSPRNATVNVQSQHKSPGGGNVEDDFSEASLSPYTPPSPPPMPWWTGNQPPRGSSSTDDRSRQPREKAEPSLMRKLALTETESNVETPRSNAKAPEWSSSSATPKSQSTPKSVQRNEQIRFIPRWQRPAEVIYQSLIASMPTTEVPGGGKYVPSSRIRTFLHQSELLPPTMKPADLDVLLAKHAKRMNYLTVEQFSDILADMAMGFIKSGIICVEEEDKKEELAEDSWEWGGKGTKTKITRRAAIQALGRVLFPEEEE